MRYMGLQLAENVEENQEVNKDAEHHDKIDFKEIDSENVAEELRYNPNRELSKIVALKAFRVPGVRVPGVDYSIDLGPKLNSWHLGPNWWHVGSTTRTNSANELTSIIATMAVSTAQ